MGKILLIGIVAGALFVSFAVAWPTIGLLGYLCIYFMKGFLVMYIPWLTGFWGYIFDMGIVCVAILGLLHSYRQERNFGEVFVSYRVWMCLIILALWVWIRLPATHDFDIGIIKVLVFSIFNTATIVLGLLCGRTEAGLRRITRALIVAGAIAIIGVFVFGRPEQGEESSRMTLGYAPSLATADMAAYPMIALMGLWFAKRTFKIILIMITVMIFSTGAIFITGTRGPFLTLPIALLVMAYLYKRQVNFRAVIITILFIVVAIFAFRYYLSISSERLASRFALEGMQGGITARIQMIMTSLSGWASNPILGTGPGDFAFQITKSIGGYTVTRYPHNLILEVADELGLIGLIPYLGLLYYGLKGMKLLSRPELDGSVFKMYAVIIFGVFIYHFAASFKTGSYAGSNIFYLSLGVAISMADLGFYELMQLQEYYNQNEMLDGAIAG